MLQVILADRYFLALASAIIGGLVALVTQRIVAKRGTLAYAVRHDRLALSATDTIFGTVQVTWNGAPFKDLYLSVVELQNESMRDYENMIVAVYSGDTVLLTERTDVIGTTQVVDWLPAYAQSLTYPPDQEPAAEQIDKYSRRREYLVPILNRGQIIRFSYLNSPRGTHSPTIWMDIVHKGVRVQYRIAHNEILGVPQPHATLVGLLLGIGVVALLIRFTGVVALAAPLAFLFGLFAQLQGVVAIRSWRWMRQLVGD